MVLSNSASTLASSFLFLFCVWLLTHYTLFKNKLKKMGLFSFLTGAFLLIWFGLVAILGSKGFFAKNPLFAPWIVFGFLILFELLRRVYHSVKIKKIAEFIPMHWLIAIQFYRIVGVGFLILYAQGILPGAFAFPAGIGDVIVGISAPIVALIFYLKKQYAKNLAIAWNIIGILDLIIALSVGFLGFPRPVQFVPLTPSTEPLSLFPLVIIPLFAVPLALLLHFLGLRVLKK